MAITTYDLSDVVLIIKDTRITGWGDGDAISYERLSPLGESVSGGDGEVVFSRTNDKRYRATLSVLPSTTAYKKLSELASEQHPSSGGSITGYAFSMLDSNNGDEVNEADAIFENIPGPSKASRVAAVEFQVLMPKPDVKLGATLT